MRSSSSTSARRSRVGDRGPERIVLLAALVACGCALLLAGAAIPAGAAAACPCSIWGDTFTPQTASQDDSGSVEVGVKFFPDDGRLHHPAPLLQGGSQHGHPRRPPVDGGRHPARRGDIRRRERNRLAGSRPRHSRRSDARTRPTSPPITPPTATTPPTAPTSPLRTTTRHCTPPRRGPTASTTTARAAPSRPTVQRENYWVDVVFEQTVARGHDAADRADGLAERRRQRRLDRRQRDSDLQRADRRSDARGQLRAPRLGRRARGRGRVLQHGDADGDAQPERRARELGDLHGDRQGRRRGVSDTAGNRLQADRTWSFTTAAPPPPPPDQGPGGPVLVVGNASNPFSRYYAEILRAEGLNAFTVTDISLVTPVLLSAYDVVVLGQTPLTPAQVTMLSDWVQSGGNLIAMRPDAQLAGLLGLTPAAGTLANGYLRIATAAAPGKGLVGETIQFHGTADRYSPSGATAVATLYPNADSPTANPAVTLRSRRHERRPGGSVHLRPRPLGRPDPAGKSGLGRAGARRPRRRSAPTTFLPGLGRPEKVAIPQADEQQRLLANLILHDERRQEAAPALLVLPARREGGRRHDRRRPRQGGTDRPLRTLQAASIRRAARSPTGSASAGRRTSSRAPAQRRVAAATRGRASRSRSTSTPAARNWTPARCDDVLRHPARATSRPTTRACRRRDQPDALHRLERLGEPAQGRARQRHPVRHELLLLARRLGQNRPGLFTGSGMPMRFADLDGTMIDVYQAATQMTDESGQSYPTTIDTLLDKALGPEGYYGVFTANMHTDRGRTPADDAIVARRQAARRPGRLGPPDAHLARRPQRLVVRGLELERATRSPSTSPSAPARTGCRRCCRRVGRRPLRARRATAARSSTDADDQGHRVRRLPGGRRHLPGDLRGGARRPAHQPAWRHPCPMGRDRHSGRPTSRPPARGRRRPGGAAMRRQAPTRSTAHSA